MKLLDLLVVDVEATEIGSGGPPSLSLDFRSMLGRTLGAQIDFFTENSGQNLEVANRKVQ